MTDKATSPERFIELLKGINRYAVKEIKEITLLILECLAANVPSLKARLYFFDDKENLFTLLCAFGYGKELINSKVAASVRLDDLDLMSKTLFDNRKIDLIEVGSQQKDRISNLLLDDTSVQVVIAPLVGNRRLGLLYIESNEAGKMGDLLQSADWSFCHQLLIRSLSDYAELQEVESSRSMFYQLLQKSPDSFTFVDESGILRLANHSTETITGYTMEELIDSPVMDIYDPEDTVKILEAWETTKEKGTSKDIIVNILTKEGKRSPVNLSLSALYDPDGKVKGSIGIIRDISKQVANERKLKEMHQKLLKANYDYKRMLNEYKQAREKMVQLQKLSSMADIIAGIAHEINNPLASIIGNIQLTLRRVSDDALKNKLERIMRDSEQARDIVRNLFSFSRSHNPRFESVNLHYIIEEIKQARIDMIKEQNIELNIEQKEKELYLWADKGLLKQALQNIIDNAMWAARQQNQRKPTVTIRVSSIDPGDKVQLFIIDNGPGINKDILGKVFDPFFTTKEVGEGSGLGLSVAYGIIESHSGSLRLSNHPDGGLIVKIILPAWKKSTDQKRN